ncbi:MAG: hypothetical protein JW993_19045 [Sedimentisphaerales bacterium]|nr:hypothetical protein [Sedimentisphaerales bacterium]
MLEDNDTFSVEGNLNTQGLLSGMAKLYHRLNLKDGTKLVFSVGDEGTIIIHSPAEPTPKAPEVAAPAVPRPQNTVFATKQLRHVHLETFRPENLNIWEPETETDVYLAFGVLQEFTDFQYCCGASRGLLDKLGADYNETSKPDAILIDRTSDQYLIAEWKKHSSDFKTNHKPEDVDVLVCWHDNEVDRTKLPPVVLALHSVAKKAAETALAEVA